MKDIIISVDSTSHKVNFPDEFLGIGYENLQGNLIFQFDNNFIGGQARLDISIDCESGMIPNLTPYENGYILPIKSSLLTGSNVLMQLVIDETSLTQYSLTTDTEINPNKTYYEKVGNDYLVVENPVVGDLSQYYEANTPVFKTDIFQLKVKDSINAQETIPEQYPTWINTLNTLIGTINQKLGLVDTALTEMNNLNINVSDKVDGEVTITFTDKQGNQKEVKINDGRGIVSILKTSTSGNIDTYTIKYTDDTTSTFQVTNGIDGTDGRGIISIEKTGTTGLIDTYTITYTDNTTSIFNVANGRGITNIEKIGTNLLVDTYRISFNDGTTQNYEVTNGKGIVSIEKTSTEGLTDIYTITYNDETTATFNVVNGKGIVSIEKTSTSGYVDTYTITYNDGTTSTYEVTNGEVSQAQLDALQDELNYYKTIVNALPKITGSGTSITLNNTADSILSNVLNPNTSQDGTPAPETPYEIHTISGDNTIKLVGKNLFDKNSVALNYTISSTGEPAPSNGSVLSDFIKVEENTNYYLSHVRGSSYVRTCAFYKADKSLISFNSVTGNEDVSGTITTPQNTAYIRVVSGTNYYETCQVEKGSTATTYTPYQEQLTQINLGVENLIPTEISAWEQGGIVYNNGENLSITTRIRTIDYYPIKKGNYYISINDTNYKWLNIIYYDSNKNFITSQVFIDTIDGLQEAVINVPNNTAYFRATIQNNASTTITPNEIANIKPMIEKGNKKNSFTPYGTTPIEYCVIGNYADIFFKNVISSPLYNATLELNKWYLKKNIDKVVLDGSENWADFTGQIGTNYYACYETNKKFGGPTGTFIVPSNYKCNYFAGYTSGLGDLQNYIASSGYAIYVKIDNTIVNSVETFKTWLSTHNVIVYYTLLSLEYVLLNDTLQSQLEYIYNQMLAYKGQTNISQINNDLPFIIDSTALKDLTSL